VRCNSHYEQHAACCKLSSLWPVILSLLQTRAKN
jgi:hypothetical protein